MNREERITFTKNALKKIEQIIADLDDRIHPCELCEAKFCTSCYICNEDKFKVKKLTTNPCLDCRSHYLLFSGDKTKILKALCKKCDVFNCFDIITKKEIQKLQQMRFYPGEISKKSSEAV